MIYTSVFEPFMMPGTMQRNATQVANQRATAGSWNPAIDLGETEEQYFVKVDVPGVPQSDIDVSVHDGVLTLKGDRKAVDDEQMTRVERASGKFERSFTLPDTADADAINAKFDLGVLTISIPKVAKAEPRRIEIQS